MRYNIIGVMSGTSLDGVDVAYCSFEKIDNTWQYKIIKAKTYPYDERWQKELNEIENQSTLQFVQLDNYLGIYFGKIINLFIEESGIDRNEIDAIASHGHTIFHQPEKRFTSQIGNGAHICAETQLKTICDFRSIDVALGGEGAPLVPIGDLLLFQDYEYCLNLGGIANISHKSASTISARDITFANMAGNYLSQQLNLSYDEGGELAKYGYLDKDLLAKLTSTINQINKEHTSLGKELFLKHVAPLFNSFEIPIKDKLHTLGVHIGKTIAEYTTENAKILVTGGGAYNNYWIEEIQKQHREVVVPNQELIDFKEALIFAFLGVLRLEKTPNCLSSVTRASKNNIGGCIYLA